MDCEYCKTEITRKDANALRHTNIEQPIPIHYFCCEEHKLLWVYSLQENDDNES